MVEAGGVRTLLAVALRKDGNCSAQSASIASEIRPFTDKQIALLQNFAAQAVIAMENARLHDRDARGAGAADRDRRDTVGHQQLAGRLTPVFDAMLDRALRLCEGAFGTLFTFDGEFFHQAATRNRKVPS